jgi:hypothetical protein
MAARTPGHRRNGEWQQCREAALIDEVDSMDKMI